MSKKRLRQITSLLLLAAASTLIYYLQTRPNTQAALTPPSIAGVAQPGYYLVTHVADGDTIDVDMNGTSQPVRLIGVDTPESVKPNSPVQCYGKEASTFTKQHLTGKQVRLVADIIGDNRDKYNRLLRYVYLPDGTLWDLKLIQSGYGFAYLSFPFDKQDEFAAAQSSAQDAKLGLWTACGTYQESGGRWQTNTAQ